MSLCEVPGCIDAAQYPKIDGQPNAIRARWCDRHALERYLGVRTPLTKQDIDALVDGLIQNGALDPASANGFASDCYLAAGLTAEGERKPGRVRCWQVSYPRLSGPAKWYATEAPSRTSIAHDAIVTPGWFVPDGAE